MITENSPGKPDFQAITLNLIDATTEKLRVYANDAANLGDLLLCNSLEQTITQCVTLRGEIKAAIERYEGKLPDAVLTIFAHGYNQIVDRGEYLAEMANLQRQFVDINGQISVSDGPAKQSNASEISMSINQHSTAWHSNFTNEWRQNAKMGF